MPDSGTELWNKKAKPFQPLGFVPNILIYRVNKLGQSKLGAVSRHVSREICCHPFSFPCDPIRVRLRSLPAVRSVWQGSAAALLSDGQSAVSAGASRL